MDAPVAQSSYFLAGQSTPPSYPSVGLRLELMDLPLQAKYSVLCFNE